MGNTKLEQIILQTIDIIASKKIASAGFNRTIQATILSCEDTARGKYKVKYQDSVFYAYTENTTVSYTNGTIVFILIPNGDMSQTKTILGAVSQTGVDYVNAIANQQEYNIIGNNIILNNSFSELCSYQTKSIILYNKDLSENILNIDNIAAKEYFNNSDSIILSADIKTNLPEEQKYQGNYGILLGLDFKDSSSDEIITRYYNLDVDTMEGNPYNFTLQTNQKQIFNIDKENFLNINTIALFVKDFPNQDENITQNDIFISNISLTGAQVLSLEDLNSYALLLKTPKGYIFTNDDVDYSSRPIEAQIRIKGQTLKSDNDNSIQYYWFIENTSINTRSPYYNKYGGQGWKCLNQYNVIQQAQVENGIEVAPAVYNFISGQSSLNVLKKDTLINQVKYKCVVIYNNNVLSREITIINIDPEYIFNMTSNTGAKFYFNKGQPTLSCVCKRKISEGSYEVVNKDNFNYTWAVVNNVGNFNTITSSDQNYTIDKNKLKVKIRTITNFSTFKCSIFAKDDNNTYLGTVSLILSNSLQNETKGYSLVIRNKNQVFKYTTTGLSPASEQLNNPIKILALDFNVYDQKGQSIGEELITNCDIIWKVPKAAYSLIQPDKNYIKETGNEQDHYDIYKDLISFVFNIDNNYSFQKTQNQIELQVVYNGIKLFDKTELVFIKEGEQGTNGTDFVCKIVPNVISGTRVPINPTIYYDGSEVSFNWQNAGYSNGEWFNIELWHNGSLIYVGNQYDSITSENLFILISKIEILHNTYVYGVADKTLINITKNENDKYIFEFDSTEVSESNYSNWRFANIIKATIRYNNMIYYATLPINFCRLWNNNYKLEFKQYSGFNRVLYTSNGINPLYDNHAPFVINTYHKNNNTWEDVSLNQNLQYDWYFIGSVWEKETDLSWTQIYEKTNQDGTSTNKWLSAQKLLNQITPLKNQKYVKPADIYNGQCVTIGMACRVYTNNGIIGWIFMPVHMSLNKFENSAINTWDGNSVELGDNGGMILAPQVGAGVKDSENKFTGIFMGTVKDPEEGLSKTVSMFNSFNELNEDVGLFGYSQGHRSIFLDAKTGKAIFGKRGAGQIIMDPSNNQAIIQSGEYSQQTGKGMQINLSEPFINFGSGNFNVDKNGILTARGVNLSDSKYNGQSFDTYITSLNESTYQEINAVLTNLKKQVDRQVMIWYNTGVPTKNNYPYIEWVEDGETLAYHEGDLYYDNNTQYAYRFVNTGTTQNPNWDWAQIQDDAVTAALKAANDAQTTANGKRRIFTATPKNTDEYDIGDLWVNADFTNSSGKVIYSKDILVCRTAKSKGSAFNINHWSKASGYLDNYTVEPRVLMNKLSQDLKDNGIWMSPNLTDNKLYINAKYINTGELSISNSSGKETFYANVDTGMVRINAESLSIKGSDVDKSFKNLRTGSNNLLRGTNKKIVFNSTSQGGSGDWGIGRWRKAANLTPTRTCISISDPPIGNIKYGWSFPNSKILNNEIAQDNVPVQIGTQYTLGCYVKGEGILIMEYGAGLYEHKTATVPAKQKWTRITWTFTVSKKARYTKNNKKTNIFIGNKGIGTLQICGISLTIGNIDNGWSQAVEDTKQEIENQFDQQEIWDRLTNNGNNVQGIELKKGKLYVNASMIKTGKLNANIIQTGILKDQKGNCEINLDKGTVKLSISELKVSVKDPKTGKTNFVSMDPKKIRVDASELQWKSQKSELSSDGKLTVYGGADITGVLKTTSTKVNYDDDWSVASKTLLSGGDLIFYTALGDAQKKIAKISNVSQFGRLSGKGFLGKATGITLRATGNSGYFVGFGSNGSEKDIWDTGKSYNVPFLYARQGFTIPLTRSNITIPKNTLHAFVPLYLHNNSIYNAKLNSPTLINPKIEKGVTQIFEFYVLYKDGNTYKKSLIRLPFKQGVLVSGTDFPEFNTKYGYRPAKSNVTYTYNQNICWELESGIIPALN